MNLKLRKSNQNSQLSSNINQEPNQIKQLPPGIKKIIKQLQNYLGSTNGGKREALPAKPPISKVGRICISLSSSSLTNLCSPLLVRECFLNRVFKKMYKAKIITHYHIRSLTDFFQLYINIGRKHN